VINIKKHKTVLKKQGRNQFDQSLEEEMTVAKVIDFFICIIFIIFIKKS